MAFSTNFLIVAFLFVHSCAQLTPDFYDLTCPAATALISAVITSTVAKEARMGASLLRLHFADCFVNGCDGSVLLNGTGAFVGEKNGPPNKNSLRGFEVIEAAKSAVEARCPGIVSCADILAIAARESVIALGGPGWDVPLGRREATTAQIEKTLKIPGHDSNWNDLVYAFGQEGFTAEEVVALSGAHTVGRAQCRFFRKRLYTEYPAVESPLADILRGKCPREIGRGDQNLAYLDPTTPDRFDNSYFGNLLANKGLLHSDNTILYAGEPIDSLVAAYSLNESLFRQDFARAMVKMSSLSPLTGSDGEIRAVCALQNHPARTPSAAAPAPINKMMMIFLLYPLILRLIK